MGNVPSFLFILFFYFRSFVCLFVCLLARAYVREGKCCKFLQMKNLQVRFLLTQKQDFLRFVQLAAISSFAGTCTYFGVLFAGFAGVFAAKCCNIVHANELRVFRSAFCEFCWCFCCKVMQYHACQ